MLEKALVWVLKRTTNPGVGGSNPSARAIQTPFIIKLSRLANVAHEVLSEVIVIKT